jgi:hypothetical protein
MSVLVFVMDKFTCEQGMAPLWYPTEMHGLVPVWPVPGRRHLLLLPSGAVVNTRMIYRSGRYPATLAGT